MEKYDDVQQFMRQQQSSGGIFAGTTVNGLRYNLTTDRRIYRRGDQMRISFTTCNTTARTITLNYNSSQRFDITVLDGGRTVWRWSDGRLFNRTPGIERLGPGECRLYRAVWDLRDRRGNFVGQGSYTIRAENMAVQLSNRFVQTRVTVSGGSQVITPPRPPIISPRPP
ncbi:MAG: BsuPI-related putative proteinase inhibitor, partial [Firmicutes bacterium]|nr:BsuPI-related putative proteinase inhibitor [Bacillota bacterium]